MTFDKRRADELVATIGKTIHLRTHDMSPDQLDEELWAINALEHIVGEDIGMDIYRRLKGLSHES